MLDWLVVMTTADHGYCAYYVGVDIIMTALSLLSY